MKQSVALFGAFVVALSLSGCGNDKSKETPGSGFDSISVEGWQNVKVTGTYNGWTLVKLDLDSYGHFKTSWNPCHQEQQGALKDGDSWAKIVKSVNVGLKAIPNTEPACIPKVASKHAIDEVVALTWPDNRPVKIAKEDNRELCSQVLNAKALQELQEGLLGLAQEASVEGCHS